MNFATSNPFALKKIERFLIWTAVALILAIYAFCGEVGNGDRFHTQGYIQAPWDFEVIDVPVYYGTQAFVEGNMRIVLDAPPSPVLEMRVFQHKYHHLLGEFHTVNGQIDTGNLDVWAMGHDKVTVTIKTWGLGGHYDLWAQ